MCASNSCSFYWLTKHRTSCNAYMSEWLNALSLSRFAFTCFHNNLCTIHWMWIFIRSFKIVPESNAFFTTATSTNIHCFNRNKSVTISCIRSLVCVYLHFSKYLPQVVGGVCAEKSTSMASSSIVGGCNTKINSTQKYKKNQTM